MYILFTTCICDIQVYICLSSCAKHLVEVHIHVHVHVPCIKIIPKISYRNKLHVHVHVYVHMYTHVCFINKKNCELKFHYCTCTCTCTLCIYCCFHLHSFIDLYVYSQYITDSGCTASSLSELKQFLDKRQQIREQLTEDLKKKRETFLIIIMCTLYIVHVHVCTCTLTLVI